MIVGIAAIARNENKYIKEWANYHLTLGVDSILICDNNLLDGERVSDVLNDDRIEIIELYLGKDWVQPRAYTYCFKEYREKYDWMIFMDIDEFIVLDPKYQTIKDFLSDPLFSDVDIIRLHWKLFSGGIELEANGNYSVLSRFKDQYPNELEKYGKSIIRGDINFTGGWVYGHGYFNNPDLKAVNSIGQPAQNHWSTINKTPVYENAWINHYPTKTIGEFIDQKYFRGGPNNNSKKYKDLGYFFQYNPYDERLERYGLEKADRLEKQKNEGFNNRT